MTATSARYSNVSQTTYDDSFTIGIFHIGDLKACCYSFTCPCCAMAESRHFLDGSPFCFNIFCLPLAPYRYGCWCDTAGTLLIFDSPLISQMASSIGVRYRGPKSVL